MEPVPVLLYVSSDEEEEVPCLEENRGRNRIIDFDWVKEFLDISDEESNEVSKHEHKSKSNSSLISTPSVEDDDDCVVLDVDPESRVTTVDGDSPTESDELVVVGEKGQIACRDYPHPRHLCVIFPYSSTPHEKHCYQCYCYVCDSVAPCPKWVTGLLGMDHCHATDESETWRTRRKIFKLGKTAPLPSSTNYSTLSDVTNAQQNNILPFRVMSPYSMLPNQTSMSTATHTCSPVNSIPQNQSSSPITMRTCSSIHSSFQNQVSWPNNVPSIATNFTIPSGTNRGRYPESGSTLARNRYQSQSIPQHSLGNRAIQRVRQHGVSTLVPQFHSHTLFNGLGSVGVGSTMPMNHSTHDASGGFSNHVNLAQQFAGYHAATGFSNDNRTSYGQNAYVPQNLWYPNPCSQPNNLSSVSNYATAHETQVSYQSNGSQNFYAVQGNNAPSSNNVAGLSRNENVCGNVTQSGTTRQYSCQQKPHDVSLIESALKADRIEHSKQSIPYQQSSGSTNTCLGSVDDIKRWLFGDENSFLVGADDALASSSAPSGLGSVDDIKRWLFSDENTVPVGADDALASELNTPSPDLSTFDGGSFFDFESSWECRARV
ncbi:uncharacterized protein LOC114406971 [Glycine soja]|uniref:Uncharacterized protein n=1 Tax=Glycine soja TaxID=3848 RepID=A0A445LCM2_GLYSO|nr:uncharacterized protein LOC114406971 [Glycine soja]KHN09395.1 hypothetical protein glysoja_016494 [Glycine soja]RZC21072.1 hypothetical protein D0Y65_007396 [Glycine soja]